jgi:uracil-DNA glycosylase family 4
MSDPTEENKFAALRWLVDAGADEAIQDTPQDRFAAPEPVATIRSQASSPRQNVEVIKSTRIEASAAAVSLSTAPGAARALAASCNTLEELKAALENFDGCELKRMATNTVFADGNPAAKIMFVGEAPGRDEDREGLPFVGRAGKLLDKMLAALGLDRTGVYITNVLPWRPPQNRDPTPEEAAICLPFLRRHIELVEPEVLVLLGAVAVRHLLGLSEGIMRTRGHWQVYQAGERTIPALPTLHPAFLLRQQIAKRLAWRDLLALRSKVEEFEVR